MTLFINHLAVARLMFIVKGLESMAKKSVKVKDPERLLLEEYAAKRLFSARRKLGLTQSELTEMLSFESDHAFDPKTVYRWESGEHPVPAWVLLHIEMLSQEFGEDTSDKTHKKAVLHKKESFIQRVIHKVRDKLKTGL